ncbi:MAG: hypothetical protein PHW60_00360 [Kiritimatiellae bacterium]|nr:hypothetical protein [Kiritimatiellia bacterium]
MPITKPHVYAHSLPGQPPDNWQPLDEHLKAVAGKVIKFGLPFAGNIRVESAQGRDYAI